MDPLSKGYIDAMRNTMPKKMVWLELWRNAMCSETPCSEIGECTTPDGIVGHNSCQGCRYSNQGV